MVHRSWFRLSIRAIGILLIGLSLPHVLLTIYDLVARSMNEAYRSGQPYWYIYELVLILSYASQGIFGVYLLFFAEGLIRKCIADSLGRCAVCQFDLQRVSGNTCPSCGTPFRAGASDPTTPPTVGASPS